MGVSATSTRGLYRGPTISPSRKSASERQKGPPCAHVIGRKHYGLRAALPPCPAPSRSVALIIQAELSVWQMPQRENARCPTIQRSQTPVQGRDVTTHWPELFMTSRANGAQMLGEIGTVPAGLMGGISFGAGDFAGGRAALRLNGLPAVAIAQLVAALTAVAVLAATGGSVPDGSHLSLAILAGACHVTAVFFLYQGMAHGRVSVIAPVAGVVGIAVPVIADIGFIQMAKPIHCVGIALAVAAIVLISQSSTEEEDRTQTNFSIRLGFISGMGYGLADLFLGLMTTSTAEGGLAVARLTGASLSFGLLSAYWFGASRRDPVALSMISPGGSIAGSSTLPPAWDANARRGLLLCALAGFLDCFGQLGYVLSATQGQMSVAVALDVPGSLCRARHLTSQGAHWTNPVGRANCHFWGHHVAIAVASSARQRRSPIVYDHA